MTETVTVIIRDEKTGRFLRYERAVVQARCGDMVLCVFTERPEVVYSVEHADLTHTRHRVAAWAWVNEADISALGDWLAA